MKLKYIHIIFILSGIFLPMLFVTAAMSGFAVSIRNSNEEDFISGRLGYSPVNQPTTLCFPNYSFYTFTFQIDFILGLGGPLVFLILYRFYKVSIIFN